MRQEFLDCVSERAKNVIQGNVPLTGRQKAALLLPQSAVAEEDFVAKIVQKGEFLTAVLPPVLSFLGCLLLK